jgi:excisionase family DNA binding protein
MESKDYRNRTYLSSKEAASYLGVSVRKVHELAKSGVLPSERAASGQMRFDLGDLKACERKVSRPRGGGAGPISMDSRLEVNGTVQRLILKSSMRMDDLPDGSVHLMITSPPYFDTKMYAREPVADDLGNVHDVDEWFDRIGHVWAETYRVLQPGRRAFINIMNLPIRLEKGGFVSLNLVGRTIDECTRLGFLFKRDIVWHKTNAVRAHFGTYPYPGGILINNMHEFILEFEKPAPKGTSKYAHLTELQKELSRLDKEFWLSIKKSDVWLMKPQGSGDRRSHIAPFPLELPSRLIRAFSFVGETVLDPFAGSGTTLLAAARLGRNGVGYEINPEIARGALASLYGEGGPKQKPPPFRAPALGHTAGRRQ